MEMINAEELSSGPPVYENDHYVVDILYIDPELEPFVDGRFTYYTVYAVTNKLTEVIEHTSVQLPEAIFTAVSLDAALRNAPWNAVKEVVAAASPEEVH